MFFRTPELGVFKHSRAQRFFFISLVSSFIVSLTRRDQSPVYLFSSPASRPRARSRIDRGRSRPNFPFSLPVPPGQGMIFSVRTFLKPDPPSVLPYFRQTCEPFLLCLCSRFGWHYPPRPGSLTVGMISLTFHLLIFSLRDGALRFFLPFFLSTPFVR